LPQVMPYIKEWELLNLLRKNGHAQHVLMSSSGLAAPLQAAQAGSGQPMLQLEPEREEESHTLWLPL